VLCGPGIHCQPVESQSSAERSPQPSERTYTTKHGTTATMKTGNIGRSESARLELHEARLIRDAEVADPGIARRTHLDCANLTVAMGHFP
jgi:hypothetical protein